MLADAEPRIVLLNWLVSRSKSRARTEEPPIESASRLFEILDGRRSKGFAVEFSGLDDENLTEENRVKAGVGRSFIRLYDLATEIEGDFKYVHLLIKHADENIKGFSVEDIEKYVGREIEGNKTERGVTAVHLVARLPAKESQLDDGRYRCVTESIGALTRQQIEFFLCRQLRRQAEQEDWEFEVIQQARRGKRPISKRYKWVPRLELHADVGRTIETGGDASALSLMVFTKRSERQNLGKEVEIKHQDVFANVQIKIPASQLPVEVIERASMLQSLRTHYEDRGFTTKLYFRHANGRVVGGQVHQAIDGAADLLMCPKGFLTLDAPVKPWASKIDVGIVKGMRELLDQDALWERGK